MEENLKKNLIRLAQTGVRCRLAGQIREAQLLEKEADLLLQSIKTFQPEQLEEAEEVYMSAQDEAQFGFIQ